MKTTTRSYYQVREFAKRSGVTIRTLHHYDQLGLLTPAETTESGYRLYSDRDFRRLQQIVTLKFIGFSLKQIKDLLDGERYDVAEMLRFQRGVLESKRHALEMAIQAIGSAERVAATGSEPDGETFERITRVISMESNKDWMKNYYTDEQFQQLQERAAADPDMVRQGERDWAELIREVEASVDEDPASEHAQSLAARWDELVGRFTQGDPALVDSLKKLYADQENWPTTFTKPYSDAAEAFINTARKARKE